MKEIDGVSWSFSDRQASKATALRKTIALRVRKTKHVAEAASMRFAAVISKYFTCIRNNVTLIGSPGSAFLSPCRWRPGVESPSM